MKFADINPHLRFAEQLIYDVKSSSVYVKDCRLFFIIEGDAKITIGDYSAKLSKNTLFYCCGGTSYTIEPDLPLRLYSLNFDLTQRRSDLIQPVPREFNPENFCRPLDKCDISDSDFLNSFFLLKNAAEFKSMVSDIVFEYSAQKAYFRENCSSMLKILLIKMHRINMEISQSSIDTLNKIIEYITLNFTKEIRNSELSEIAGYHEFYLNRIFKKQTGVSIHKYILNLRINEGKRLLLNTNMPVSDIASKTGFNSNTHFSTYFKKETGLTPFEYRNNFKNNI